MRPAASSALAAAAVLLAACTPMAWVKADATPEQLREDAVQCQQDAWREASLRSWYYQPFGPSFLRDRFGNRIVTGPYGVFPGPYGDPFMEESRLAQFCMRSKGYSLQRVEKGAAASP
jgi:hypothetical protein